MSEDEWLTCADPIPMVRSILAATSDRKARLFAVACCRKFLGLLNDDRSRVAIEVSERFADQFATAEQLRDAAGSAPQPYPPDEASEADPTPDHSGDYFAEVVFAYGKASAACAAAYSATLPITMDDILAVSSFAVDAAVGVAAADAIKPFLDVKDYEAANSKAKEADMLASHAEWKGQSALARDVWGNPFRHVTLDPSWLTPSVVRLAQSVHDERSFDCLPELADALEATGCTSKELLEHCRGLGPHVRGCWVLDLILGKE